jgi:uncharacterized membrane protein YbhN (UPF0104 family)
VAVVEPAAAGVRSRVVRVSQLLGAVVLFAAVAFAAARDWSHVRATLEQISAHDLLLAELLALVSLVASVLTWRRSLSELGSSTSALRAGKVYLLGQLGKYIPGSVWAFLIQMELGRRCGVPRARAMTASIVAAGINVLTGLALGVLVVPSVANGSAWRYAGVAVGLAACVVALTPPVLGRVLDLLMRTLRKPPFDRRVTWGGMSTAAAWSVTSWLAAGLSLWLLALSVHLPAGESLLLCLGGVPLAMAAGVFVFVAPSGIGVREAVLVAALSPVANASSALALALVLRLVFTLADFAGAALVLPVRMSAESA